MPVCYYLSLEKERRRRRNAHTRFTSNMSQEHPRSCRRRSGEGRRRRYASNTDRVIFWKRPDVVFVMNRFRTFSEDCIASALENGIAHVEVQSIVQNARVFSLLRRDSRHEIVRELIVSFYWNVLLSRAQMHTYV